MRRKTKVLSLVTSHLLFLVLPCDSQLKLDLDHLAARASESVRINLDRASIQLAGRFLSSSKQADPKLQEVLSGIEELAVRVYEFPQSGAYTQADLQPLRNQFKDLNWRNIVSVQEKGEGVEIYVGSSGSGPSGVAILAWQPRELTAVYVRGRISVPDLMNLAGKLGIPEVAFSGPGAPPKAARSQSTTPLKKEAK